jgi:hypothetical protein
LSEAFVVIVGILFPLVTASRDRCRLADAQSEPFGVPAGIVMSAASQGYAMLQKDASSGDLRFRQSAGAAARSRR